jgi:regulator of sigma E protease
VNHIVSALLWQVPIGLCVLSFLVLIHEGGHFLAARRAGVVVDAFAVGFGPRLVGLKVGETEYRICAVPFGGYVAMRGEEPGDVEGAAKPGSFDSVSLGWRAVIVSAGPVVNILFAVVVLWVAGMVGVREPAKGLVVGSVATGSPADLAGIRFGDSLVAMEGKSVAGEQAVVEHVALNKGRAVHVTIRRGGVEMPFTFVPLKFPEPQLDLGWSGIQFGGRILVENVIPGGAAEQAGIQTGDTLLAMDGKALSSPQELPVLVNATAGRVARIALARPGARLALNVAARWSADDKRWLIGVMPGSVVPMELHRYGPVDAMGRSLADCWDKGTAIFRFLGALFSGRLAVKNLAGPVGIVQMSGAAAREGWQKLIELMAMISINLGVLNFLPLVVTDGGRLVELAVEKVRGRRANRRFMEVLTNVVVYLFLALAVYVTFHDLLRAKMFLR